MLWKLGASYTFNLIQIHFSILARSELNYLCYPFTAVVHSRGFFSTLTSVLTFRLTPNFCCLINLIRSPIPIHFHFPRGPNNP